jgi:hypothetical protein
MNHTYLGIWGAIFLAVSACPAAGPRRSEGGATPGKVVRASLKASREGDWDAYAGLIHPDSLRDFKALLVPVLQSALKNPDERADLQTLFGKATDLKAVLKLEPKEFFARFARGALVKSPLKDNFASFKGKVLGVVREGPDLAHVVVRLAREGPKGVTPFALRNKVEVVTVRRTPAGWRILLPGDLRTLADTIRRSGAARADVQKAEDTIPPDPDR